MRTVLSFEASFKEFGTPICEGAEPYSERWNERRVEENSRPNHPSERDPVGRRRLPIRTDKSAKALDLPRRGQQRDAPIDHISDQGRVLGREDGERGLNVASGRAGPLGRGCDRGGDPGANDLRSGERANGGIT